MEIDPSNPIEAHVVVERYPDGNTEIRLYQDREEADKRVERESEHDFKEVTHEPFILPSHFSDVHRDELIAAWKDEDEE